MATPGVRSANRILALLVALISLRLLIYVFGFAGLYDDHPWITFAPLDASLAFGPLIWLAIVRLTTETLPRHWRWHFLPVLVQLTYSFIAFSLPLDDKLRWFRGPHLDYVEPLGLLAMLSSSATYLYLGWQRQRDYQRWLDEHFADREPWRLGWITAILAAFALTFLVALAAAGVNATVIPLDYFNRTPVIIASSLLAYALGLLGWRHADLQLPPQPIDAQPSDDNDAVSAPQSQPSRPAAAFGQWAARIEGDEWWRENGLTLAKVAKRLGTSERTLSRGLSEAAGCNFNMFINRLRVNAVIGTMAQDSQSDLLALAFDAGFNSKASFNRAFRRQTGMTPSQWRASASQVPPIEQAGVI